MEYEYEEATQTVDINAQYNRQSIVATLLNSGLYFSDPLELVATAKVIEDYVVTGELDDYDDDDED